MFLIYPGKKYSVRHKLPVFSPVVMQGRCTLSFGALGCLFKFMVHFEFIVVIFCLFVCLQDKRKTQKLESGPIQDPFGPDSRGRTSVGSLGEMKKPALPLRSPPFLSLLREQACSHHFFGSHIWCPHLFAIRHDGLANTPSPVHRQSLLVQ